MKNITISIPFYTGLLGAASFMLPTPPTPPPTFETTNFIQILADLAHIFNAKLPLEACAPQCPHDSNAPGMYEGADTVPLHFNRLMSECDD